MNLYDSVMKSFQTHLFNNELHKCCPFYPGVSHEVIDYDLLIVKLSTDLNTIMFYINKEHTRIRLGLTDQTLTLSSYINVSHSLKYIINKLFNYLGAVETITNNQENSCIQPNILTLFLYS